MPWNGQIRDEAHFNIKCPEEELNSQNCSNILGKFTFISHFRSFDQFGHVLNWGGVEICFSSPFAVCLFNSMTVDKLESINRSGNLCKNGIKKK